MSRELVVEIGPFQEYVNAPGQTGIRLVSNGDINSLKIKAHVERTIIGVPNPARIQIWNLSRSTRDSLRTPGLNVNLWCSQDGTETELLYKGSLLASPTYRSGADWVTTLVCRNAYSNLVQNVVSKTWERDVPVDQVVREIVAEIPGVIYSSTNPILQGKIGYNGFTVIGTLLSALKRLGDQFGFSWTIDNGVFFALMDNQASRTIINLNSLSGLRKVSPRLSGIMQTQVGVDIECLYRPGIASGQLVRIDASTSAELSGNYRAHTIEYDLCPKGEEWNMTITSMIQLMGDQPLTGGLL